MGFHSLSRSFNALTGLSEHRSPEVRPSMSRADCDGIAITV